MVNYFPTCVGRDLFVSPVGGYSDEVLVVNNYRTGEYSLGVGIKASLLETAGIAPHEHCLLEPFNAKTKPFCWKLGKPFTVIPLDMFTPMALKLSPNGEVVLPEFLWPVLGDKADIMLKFLPFRMAEEISEGLKTEYIRQMSQNYP